MGKPLLAHRIVAEEIRLGRLKRQFCVRCGNPRTDAHHGDYSKPLDVVWLCRKHHSEEHQKTHCAHGHPFTPENIWFSKEGWRQCRVCHRMQQFGVNRLKAKTGPTIQEKNLAKTHCPNGHPYSGDNLYIDARGWRGCKTCRNAAARKGGAICVVPAEVRTKILR